MKLFNKIVLKRAWIAILASIPILFFVLWIENGTIGLTEIVIVALTLTIGIGILYIIKFYSNKN